MGNRHAVSLIFAALVCGGALRAWTVFTKPVFYHDESHSYQVATGHAGETAQVIYDRRFPNGQWAEAHDWKRLMRPEHALCFLTISADTHAYDVHPPLYYWLLHVACLAFGTNFWTGTLLNAVIDLLTIAALYRFATRATGDATAGAAAAFLWAVGAGALQVAVVEARQYSLLTLVAVMWVDQLSRVVLAERGGGRIRLLAVFALTLAGALTHHHFALIVAGAFAWFGLTRIRTARRQLLLAGAAVALAYLALLGIHPFFSGTGYKHLSDARLPDAPGLAVRGRQALEALAHVIFERRFSAALPIWAVAVAASIVPAAFLLAWRTIRRAGTQGDRNPAGPFALFLGVWLVIVTIGLYLTGVSPAHAMSYRYLAMAWPFVAIAVATAARGRFATVGVCTFALAFGTSAAWMQWHRLEIDPSAARADELLRTGRRFVIDNTGRGHWPRPLWRLPDDAIVMCATPNDLLKRPAAWRRGLAPGTVYVSPSKSAIAPREKIVALLRETHDVELVAHLHAIGDVFLIGAERPSVAGKSSDD